MSRPTLYLALVASLLLAFFTRVDAAECFLCPVHDLEPTTPVVKNQPVSYEILDHWTCDAAAETFTCFYQSYANPGTYNNCTYGEPYGLLVSGSTFCVGGAPVESKCDQAILQGTSGCMATSGTTQR
ncbi:hypothetical protein JAAARDRAFT_60030 [Jaapia argillacea MUCL 33604]|uniref:Uncharacterized protein n=1 Tax=Jaapia argillacea MUCL 33604 TaxID=933084 RepID=A0A067PJF0_9AGAM|nr:hypothetical protein JAAARDRAFT_60030 [Jaapia argillacea MUCL 33604]